MDVFYDEITRYTFYPTTYDVAAFVMLDNKAQGSQLFKTAIDSHISSRNLLERHFPDMLNTTENVKVFFTPIKGSLTTKHNLNIIVARKDDNYFKVMKNVVRVFFDGVYNVATEKLNGATMEITARNVIINLYFSSMSPTIQSAILELTLLHIHIYPGMNSELKEVDENDKYEATKSFKIFHDGYLDKYPVISEDGNVKSVITSVPKRRVKKSSAKK